MATHTEFTTIPKGSVLWVRFTTSSTANVLTPIAEAFIDRADVFYLTNKAE
jgi:hypothetical protein